MYSLWTLRLHYRNEILNTEHSEHWALSTEWDGYWRLKLIEVIHMVVSFMTAHMILLNIFLSFCTRHESYCWMSSIYPSFYNNNNSNLAGFAFRHIGIDSFVIRFLDCGPNFARHFFHCGCYCGAFAFEWQIKCMSCWKIM